MKPRRLDPMGAVEKSTVEARLVATGADIVMRFLRAAVDDVRPGDSPIEHLMGSAMYVLSCIDPEFRHIVHSATHAFCRGDEFAMECAARRWDHETARVTIHSQVPI